MMLSACARGLVEARRKGKMKSFSFRTYLFDLVQLLKESMTGDAATACFVCVSQAPANLMQTKIALEFGEVFAKLSNKPIQTRPQPRVKLVKEANALLREANKVLGSGKGGGIYTVIREAQKFDCEQSLELIGRLASM